MSLYSLSSSSSNADIRPRLERLPRDLREWRFLWSAEGDNGGYDLAGWGTLREEAGDGGMGGNGGNGAVEAEVPLPLSGGKTLEFFLGESCLAAITGASHRTSFAQSSSVYVCRRISVCERFRVADSGRG